MKSSAIVLVLIGLAGVVLAGPIYDVQTGVYAEGAEVVVDDAIVIAVRGDGIFISEDTAGPYTGVWVYTGSDPGVSTGDLVDVKGLYAELDGLTTIDVSSDPTGSCTFDSLHMGALTAVDVHIAQLNADPEPWESTLIRVRDGMMVGRVLEDGEWEVESADTPGEFMVLDDFWYDVASVMVGDCYLCAGGVYYESGGGYKLEPFVDHLCLVNCSVANESMSFGQVKALYR